jgi:benzoyl-CoA reductase/2-hydroxyglutaryl-CoA dehydratase subunit BcrC/BadD/HgdB
MEGKRVSTNAGGPRRKRIEATAEMRKMMSSYYSDLDASTRTDQRKVAWCTSVGPAELLRAMDFDVYFPENHGAMLGASRVSTDMIPAATAIGYSPEVCSYMTSDIGAFLRGETPLKGAYGIESVPTPDVLVFNTNQCRDVQEWFTYFGRRFDAPVVGIDSPKSVRHLNEAIIRDVQFQMEALVPHLERVTGEPLDKARLSRTVELSLLATRLWNDVLDTAATSPSPLTFFDGVIQMGPIVVLRGTQEAVDYYDLLLAEMKARIREGVSAVDGERHRIYWEGMPIWGRLRSHSELFARLRCSVVASTYCNSWVFNDLDPSDPWRSMALAYTGIFIVRSEQAKERYIRDMIKHYSIDGLVFHDAKTCAANSNARYGMPQRLQEETGIPTLVIDGDLNDLRCVSDEQMTTNIEAFVEGLG